MTYITSDAPPDVATPIPPTPRGALGERDNLQMADLPSSSCLAFGGGASTRAGKLVQTLNGPASFVPSTRISVVLPGATVIGTNLVTLGWASERFELAEAQRNAASSIAAFCCKKKRG